MGNAQKILKIKIYRQLLAFHFSFLAQFLTKSEVKVMKRKLYKSPFSNKFLVSKKQLFVLSFHRDVCIQEIMTSMLLRVHVQDTAFQHHNDFYSYCAVILTYVKQY